MCDPVSLTVLTGGALISDQQRKAQHAVEDQVKSAQSAQQLLLQQSKTPVAQLLSPEEVAARASAASGTYRSPFARNPLRLGGTSDGTGLSVPSGGG